MCGLFGFSDPKHTLTQKQIRYSELVRYLKERRLYVNEPIPAEGEV